MKLNKKGFIIIFSFIFFLLFTSTLLLNNKKISKKENSNNKIKEVINENVDNEKQEIYINKPYNENDITIKKNYYNYKDDSDKQENSILKFDNIYIQNNAIAYGKKNPFKIISILEGEVTSIKNDELLGKIIEIKHENNIVSIYQSLTNIKVNKGDFVKQGQEIGESISSKDKALENYFLFELVINNNIVNPENYIGKKILSINE